MNKKFVHKSKRLLSGIIATTIAVSMLPTISAFAETGEKYPYTLFAGSSADGAISTTAYNFCVNGNVATNGTISAPENMNINGTKTENANEDMIYIFDKIDSKYFSSDNVDEHIEDYTLQETNININTPTEVMGETTLTGNININTALKAFEDITLNGEVKNTNDSVIYSKYGDIVIDSTNVNLNGLVYAPFGSIEIKTTNLNLNNVVIIADSIAFDCPNLNANFSNSVADFVGNISEPLNIPKDEWQYMKDENENDLPDFFENFNNWEKLIDTDGDSLPDSIEEYLGSDSNNIDTDGDRLDDYYEVFVTYTDPTKSDTDENSINDGDEDFDEDKLSNLEEFANKTNPYIDDMDGDGLADGDEIKIYKTDPLVADTDGDQLDDSDELILGTNPLVTDTDGNGIIDSKEKIQQNFTHKVKNEDCAVTEVMVDMDCTGNINTTTIIKSVMNVDILCTDVVGLVGEPFEIETVSEFNKATITFKIDKEKLDGVSFDNLLFLWYNEEENEFVELETTLNEENSTASVVTTHFSKYMVVDKYQWFRAWSEEFDYNPTGDGTGAPTNPVKYNTVLAIDCSGSMSGNDPISTKSSINSAYDAQHPYICNRITAAEEFIKYMKLDDETAIVLFTDSAYTVAPITSDKETLKLALQKMYSYGNTSFSAALNASITQINSAKKILNGVNKNRIILLSDGDDLDDENRRNVAINACKEKDIEVYTVGFGAPNDSILEEIAQVTGGKYYKAMSAEDIIDEFAKYGYEKDFDMTDTDGDGLPDAVETAGIRLQNGKILNTDPIKPDTDGDGLLDGEEINPKPLYSEKEDNGWLGIKKLFDANTIKGYYFTHTSDPTKVDSDGDGLLDRVIVSGDKGDIEDPYPLNYNHFINLGSEEYMVDLISRFENSDYYKYVYPYEPLHKNPLVDEEPYEYYETIVNLMMFDVNNSELHNLVPFENWDNFCEFFNYNLTKSGGINREKHFFRNKLNRTPSSISELIDQNDKWIICAFGESKYHLLGNDGGFNLKFISNCGKFEAVYDKYGNLITENNGAKNMGTYNYANFKQDVYSHTVLDVIPYMCYGNSPGTLGQIIPDTSAYDNNRLAQNYHNEMESLFNNQCNTSNLQEAYKQIRQKYNIE